MKPTRSCSSVTTRPGKTAGGLADSFGHPASRLALVRHQFEIDQAAPQAKEFVEVPQGGESTAVRWLAGGDAQLDAAAFEGLSALKPLSNGNNVVIVFGRS